MIEVSPAAIPRRMRVETGMLRSALIVDDSRVALAALGRMLRERGIVADTVESGTEALDYLRHNVPPGAIFLDHMMPGMDGFETLAALKASPQTAAIPVIMFTSKEGDAYMAQALTQGAVGVLHKPIDPIEFTQILQQVGKQHAPATASIDVASVANRPTSAAAGSAAVTGAIRIPSSLRAGQGTAETLGTGIDPNARSAPVNTPVSGLPTDKRFAGRNLSRVALALVLLVPGVWLYQRYHQAERARAQLEQENLRLRAEQVTARASTTTEETSQLRTAIDAREQRDRRETIALLNTVVWAVNQQGQYALDDQPLGDERLVRVQELVKRLTVAGFRGALRIEIHSGQFCIQRDERGEARLARDNLPLSQCEILVQAPEPAVQLGLHESAAFARYLAEQGADSNPVQISVISRGTSRPLVPYPDAGNVTTAGEWNRVAALNQRVEIALQPVP